MNIKRLLLITVVILIAPSFICLLGGKFRYQPIIESTSPDGQDTVKIMKRYSFPVFRPFDPAVVIKFEVNGVLTSLPKFEYKRESDLLDEPEIKWSDDFATIPTLSHSQSIWHDLKVTRKK